MFELNNFDAIQIGLASPEQVRKWSRGEVKKPETINYRTLKPERDGLFCERIFGPMKDWECHCGKYKRVRYKGIVCDRCGVEVTKAKVRRERMGHIELAAPVSHIWYFKGIPSRMGLILDMSPRALEKILYFASYVVIDPKETPLLKKQLLNEKEYREAADKYGEESFVAGMGAEAVKQLLGEIDLEAQSIELKEELKQSTGQKKVRIIRRLEVIESFKKSGNDPKWMIIDVIPVIPPDLRPMVQLDGGRFATSDLNDLYRRVINRNNRLKKLLDLGAPDIIVRNEKRMLQEAVDALVDNGRRGRAVTGPGNRPLKSLSDMLKGKQGRFRQNLLGKRVDYSGRSVIVVGPELKMYQCGLPKEMALELFKPFVMKKLVEDGIAHNIKSAKRMVERVMPQVWDVLEEVIADHPVLLNRAPTLHRLGIQAFQPVLVEGRAIKLHPLVCTAYNADFDGDQMAVHVPLSVEAQAEARFLMLAAGNILKPSDGKPVCVPTQDMVLGSYYLTIDKEQEKEDKYFYSKEEAIMAYELKEIGVHDKIHVKLFKTVDGVEKTGIIKTTVGKLIFNESIPQDLGFVDRNNKDEEFNLEVDFLVTKKSLGKIIDKCYLKHGPTETSIMLDKIKALGYHYSSIGAITVAASDMIVPKEKYDLLRDADETIEKIEKMYKRGFISDDERYERVIEKWTKTTEEVADTLMESLDKFNPIFMMADSGARGSKSQIKQLAGMRGLMASPSGKIIELPIRASFREGLDVLEYFLSTHGARKGNADTALKTADSGYLTRRLVDVSQDVIVREEDCGATDGMVVSEIREGNEVVEGLAERLTGRYLAEDVINPSTGEVIANNDTYVDSEMAETIVATGVKKVKIRSVFTCKCKIGVCAKCYGMNMATAKKINIGEAVGIIAAQSIGEPGTQLTMRTFHTGGVAGADITQGLPRVEELFEARKPKGLAIVSEISGTVRIEETKKKRTVYVMGADGEEKSYDIPFGSRLKVNDNDVIEAGDEVTEGSVNPHDIMNIKGIDGARRYLLSEVQKVYRLQGVDINDKHLEVVVRQMTRKIKVTDSGDTELLPGTMIDIFDFEEANEKVREFGGEEATGEQALLGITKAALATDSFLSAASFQETTRVLTEAAIKGKTDPLVGLKENVIIGKLIPAGTGMMRYRTVKLDVEEDLTMDDSLLKVE
ncbi:DNA-directed RNA polymerase subunit beta' [Clostridium paraputrificum]|uniref:DNA-directed RNA polymerase subunit beta' n=1 Tax=Clostridium paraputrificum TaxID=29363 RepID=UPI0011CBAF45|nr:DNA-directed RNA polymerase subunit beta' [Clostridium paraputrificum]